MTKINIYYSFDSILRPKGVLLLPHIMTKRSTPLTPYFDQKEYSFYSGRSSKNDKNEYLLLLLLYFETKGSTPFAQYYDQKEYSFYPERSCQNDKNEYLLILLLYFETKRSTLFAQLTSSAPALLWSAHPGAGAVMAFDLYTHPPTHCFRPIFRGQGWLHTRNDKYSAYLLHIWWDKKDSNIAS